MSFALVARMTAAFSIPGAFRFGWASFKRNAGPALALGAATLVVMFLLNAFTQAAQRHGMLSLGSTLLAQLAQIFFAFLWIRFALTVYDGRPIRARELFPDGRLFLTYVAVAILYGLLVTAGLILLIVPGIYLAVCYGLASFVVADERNADVIGAFRESADATRGSRWRLFLFGLAAICVNVLGAMLFGVGLLVTMPVTTLAAAMIYRRLVAAPAPERYLTGPPAPLTV